MSNTKPKDDLINTPENEKIFRVTPIPPKTKLPKPFPSVIPDKDKNVGEEENPFFDGLGNKERSLIVEEKKGGSLKYKKHHSYKNKKRITRKMRKSRRNKKHNK